jgi:hypothetical protein
VKVRPVVIVLFLVAASVVAPAQSAPIRPGIRQADQAEAQTAKNLPPPSNTRTRIDLAKVSHEADELARIAQTIPPDVATIQRKVLPKDVLEKLKQIEKLSKRLRSELER